MSKPTVMLIEDDEHAITLLTHVLGFEGLEVRSARTVAQAIEQLKIEVPRILLLDIMLPGENGDAVLRYLDETGHLASTFVLVMSAHDYHDFLPMDYVPDAVLRKPASLSELRKIIQQALRLE